MPIDLGILGLILTFLAPGLFQFESIIFGYVDPKDFGPALDVKAEKALSRMVSMVFQEMDDDVTRSTLSSEKRDAAADTAFRESLVQKRHYVAQELSEIIWKETTNHLKIRGCFNSWSRWAGHGRFTATVCTYFYFVLFALLSVMFFTNSLPMFIRNYYYWIAFAVLVIPLTYIFICWLVASHWKKNFDRLSDK